MKIGFSIRPNLLQDIGVTEQDKQILSCFGSVTSFLQELKSSGITSIEIRTIEPQQDPEKQLEMAEKIWGLGLEVSIHAHLNTCKAESFAEIYPSTAKLLNMAVKYQKNMVYTVHAFNSRDDLSKLGELRGLTEQALTQWLMATQKDKFVNIALELTRAKGICDPAITDEGVADMVHSVGHNRLGACWDMGHYYHNHLYNKENVNILPSKRFLKTVSHTHIHGVDKIGTHAPLSVDKYLPLELYIKALKQVNYLGIYNLELSTHKLEPKTWQQEIFKSIQRLILAVQSSSK